MAAGSGKFLFLDMDGVVCINGVLKDVLLARVGEIQRATGCTVILSSDWRRYKDARLFAIQTLERFGVRIKGHTPILRGAIVRPLEIVTWLKRFARGKLTTFIAIDDRSLLLEDGGHLLKGRFVQTRPLVGINQATVERCVELLNQAPPVDTAWWAAVCGDEEPRANGMLSAASMSTMHDMSQLYLTPTKKGQPTASSEHEAIGFPTRAPQTRPRTAPGKRSAPGSPSPASKSKPQAQQASPTRMTGGNLGRNRTYGGEVL